MPNFLCVDSGGTKSVAIVFDEKMNIMGRGNAGGGNANLSTREKALENVIQCVNSALFSAGTISEDIAVSYLFIPGFTDCLEEFNKRTNLNAKMKTESEELHHACLNGENGVIVLSGTGSFATAYEDGKRFSVGGWGHLFSDEGSGFDIGATALRKCARGYDLGEKYPLIELICEHFDVSDFLKLRRKIYAFENSREQIASLCKIVCKLAESGDKLSNDILNENARKLAQLAVDAYKKSKVIEPRKVTLSGGLSKAGEIFADKFKKQITELSGGKLVYINSTDEPVIGAMKMLLADFYGEQKNIEI